MSIATNRIILNVGGRRFETTEATLRRIPNTRLTHLLDEGVGTGNDEIFIDRSSSNFEHVLNYLRNGYIQDILEDDNLFDVLEKEAQFYGISELANLCRNNKEPLKVQERVRWRRDAIPHYSKLFLKSIIDSRLVIPFTYERNSYFFAKCIACEENFDPKCTNVYGLAMDEWSALGHHMQGMLGIVEKAIGHTCVLVRWDNSVTVHIPITAVRRYFHSSEKIEHKM